jgi:REP element-mobilizing transposase RayT
VDDSRVWLLTWTCYGNWLPGDERGFVSGVQAPEGRVVNNAPGTEYDRDVEWLRRHCRLIQKGATTRLERHHAEAALAQFHETAAHRGWDLLAAAVMHNHAHLVVWVPGDPDPEKLLHSFKSYATRTLNKRFGRREWWTESGSTRVKKTRPANVTGSTSS